VEAVRRARFFIVVDYANAPAAMVLPSILRQLGVRVVELNAAIDESMMSIPPEDFDRALKQLASICAALGTKLGVRLDVGGEKIFLVDDCGNVLDGGVATAVFAALALRACGGGTIAAPVTMSRTLDEIASQHNGKVLRTRADTHSVMEAATQGGVILAADGANGFACPEFLPAPDGMMALARLLEFLARENTGLCEVASSLPEQHMAMRSVPCPWESKGTVMRLLHERYRESKDEQIDGIKVRLGHDWVLVLPDPDRPFFRVYAESDSAVAASDLADKYAHIVESLQE
jgi:mannose-1-phosphate guanylyltransferase/phosphomannomutase